MLFVPHVANLWDNVASVLETITTGIAYVDHRIK